MPDRRYDRYKFPIHDYFIAKSLDQVRPGGLVAVVTSSGTLDKENPAARKYFAERADLLGAVRLSEQTFQKTAGTNAVTDILFLQKRDRAPIEEPSWVQLGETSHGCSINQYYIEHPEMILGDLVPEQNQYGETSLTVKARKDLSLEEQLSRQSPISKVPYRYGNSQTATWTWKSPFPLILTFQTLVILWQTARSTTGKTP